MTHGGDGRQVARSLGLDPDTILDLSASLNPVAPDVRKWLDLDVLGTYPDPTEATQAMAAALRVAPECVLLTNGGAEAIALLAGALGSGAVVDPEFSLYRRHLPSVDAGAGRWRSDPHNPTGLLAGPLETAAVWDEAFYPLATGRWSSGRPATAVLGSLTKVFACPGLRAGYVVAGADLIARLADRQPRWAVNGLVCAALPAMLAEADLELWARETARLRLVLVEVLREHGLCPAPSDANFVLVPGARGLRDWLAPRGVVVRDCASFGLPDHVRIAVPDDDGLACLDRALEGWR